MNCEQFLDEMDAFALGALEPDEAAAVARHAADCADCAAALRAANAVAERLLLAPAAVRAPVALRERVLSLVAAEASAATPPVGLANGAALPAGGAAFARTTPASIPPAAPRDPAAPVQMRGADRTPVSLSAWRRFSGAGFRLPAAAAAAIVIALLGLASWSLSLQQQLGDVKTRQRLASVNGAGRAAPATETALVLLSSRHTVTGELNPQQPGQASGGVIWNPDKRRCVILTQQLPPLPSGMEYRVWFREGDAKWDGGALQLAGDGSAETVVDMSRWQVGQGYTIAIVAQPIVDDGTRRPVLAGTVEASLQ